MALHRLIHPESSAPLAPGPITIAGDEAHHAARSKRLEPGDAVEILDGAGARARATIARVHKLGKGTRAEWALDLTITHVAHEAPARPAIHVRSAAPKGERLEALIDALSQVGAASWGTLVSERAIVEPREGKLSRLDRTAGEAMKQCGRSHRLTIHADHAPLEAVLAAPPARGPVVVADASGGPYARLGAAEITLVVGPEGGFSPAELARARAAGARVCAFGPHAMRIEAAAFAACAVMLHAEHAPA